MLCLFAGILFVREKLRVGSGNQLSFHQRLKLIRLNLLVIVQIVCHRVQLIHMVGQNLFSTLVGCIDELTHLTVNLERYMIGIVLGLVKITAQENFALARTIYDGAQLFAKAILGHHAARQIAGPLNIVGSAGGDIIQHQLFRHTAAQQHHQILLHLAFPPVVAVLRGQRHGKSSCHSSGNDGNLVYRILGRTIVGAYRVTGFVESGEAFVLGRHHMGFLLRTSHHLDGRLLDILHHQRLASPLNRQQRGLVEQVFQIRSGKTGGGLGDGTQIYVGTDGFVAGVYLQNGLPPFDVGIGNHHLTVKPAGAQQRRVQNIPTVGGGDDNNAGVGGKTIHLHQKLVEGLFPLVVTAAETGAAVTAHRINLIDKHNAGGVLFGLFKQIADTGSTHAHKHLHKIGTGDGEKGNPCLAGYRPCQQGFTGTGRAHEQNAFGNPGAQIVEAFGIFEESHNLLQLRLLLVCAGHIVKGHSAPVGLRFKLCFAEVHHVSAATGLTHHKKPQRRHRHNQQQRRKQRHPPRGGFGGNPVIVDAVIGISGIVLLHKPLDVIQKQGNVGNIVFHRIRLSFHLHGELSGAEIQGVFLHLILLEQLDYIGIDHRVALGIHG